MFLNEGNLRYPARFAVFWQDPRFSGSVSTFKRTTGPYINSNMQGFPKAENADLVVVKGARPLLQPNSSKMGGTAKKDGSNGNVLTTGYGTFFCGKCVEHPLKTIPKKGWKRMKKAESEVEV